MNRLIATVWSQTSDSHVIGKVVLTPDQVRLTYAALGEDATQQAILAVEVDAVAQMFVAIATPVQGGWERVAAADCWCKYDMGGDALGEFVHVENLREPVEPTRFQLVIRASGGGTGLYKQDEGHFVMHGGELRRVLFFTSRYLSCDPTRPCARLRGAGSIRFLRWGVTVVCWSKALGNFRQMVNLPRFGR